MNGGKNERFFNIIWNNTCSHLFDHNYYDTNRRDVQLNKFWQKIKDKITIKLSLIPFLTGLMYSIAGSENTPKQIRRFGIPILLTFFSWLYLQNIWVLTMLSQIGVYHIGHGIPDATDSGSSLGRFWYNLFNSNHLWADIFTRGTKAFLIAVSCLSIPVLKGNWAVYLVSSLILTISIASIAWRGLGEKIIKIGDKKYTLLYVDIIVGSLIGFYTLIIVRF